MALKELLMHVPDPTEYQAFVGLLRNPWNYSNLYKSSPIYRRNLVEENEKL